MNATDNDHIEYRIAETREDLEGAARLVYGNYIQKGYCGFNIYQFHFHRFDVLPETRVAVAVQNGRVIATLTLVFDSGLGLPSDSLYGKELALLRNSGRRLAEITKLSIDRAVRARQVSILHQLSRLAYLAAAKARGITAFCIQVEPHHERFYRKICLFERMGEEREDPCAANAPTILLCLNLVEAPEKAREAFGESAEPSNFFWFYFLDPQAKRLEAEIRAADLRLSEIDRVRNDDSLTAVQCGYLAFRKFVRGFVANYGKAKDWPKAKESSLKAVS